MKHGKFTVLGCPLVFGFIKIGTYIFLSFILKIRTHNLLTHFHNFHIIIAKNTFLCEFRQTDVSGLDALAKGLQKLVLFHWF